MSCSRLYRRNFAAYKRNFLDLHYSYLSGKYLSELLRAIKVFLSSAARYNRLQFLCFVCNFCTKTAVQHLLKLDIHLVLCK